MNNNSGAMIAFFLPGEITKELAEATSSKIPEYTEPQDSEHLTLVYIGEAGEVTEEKRLKLQGELEILASSIAPITASINGVGRFKDKDPNAIYANFDAPGLTALRRDILQILRDVDIEPTLSHGFTPHVTLAYLPDSEPTPDIELKPINCLLDSITLAVGDERHTYPLIGTQVTQEMEVSKTKTVSESLVMSDDGDAFDAGDIVSYIDNEKMKACLGIIRSIQSNGYASVEKIDSNLQPTGQTYQSILTDLTEYNIPGYGDDDDAPASSDEDDIEVEEFNEDDWNEWNRVYGTIGWALVSETAPNDAPDDDYAYVPNDNKSDRKLYIGDKTHAHEAAVAIGNGEYRGNKLDIPPSAMSAIKRKVAGAVRKYFTGVEQKYLLTWIKTGKKPAKKTDKVSETAIIQEISLNTPSFEFRGKFPDVPFAPGVNVAELIKDDPDPLYVIRPLAIIGAVSENHLEYDKALVESIQQQVLSKRIPARRGHVSEEASSYEFPEEVGLWVGALLQENTLYGKCYTYPSNGSFREMIRKRKAAGSGIGNSIFGKGEFQQTSDGVQHCTGLELESIDFAPPERAALNMGRDFETTAEMIKDTNKKVKEMSEIIDTDKTVLAKHLSEMSNADVYEMLSDGQKQHVVASHIKEMSPSAVCEMLSDEQKQHVFEARAKETKLPDTKAIGEMTHRISELETANKNNEKIVKDSESIIREFREREYDRTLDSEIDLRFSSWQVNLEGGKEKLAEVKADFKEKVVTQMEKATDKNDVKTIVDQAWEAKKTILELQQSAIAGPSAFIAPVDNMKPMKWDGKLSSEEDARAARQALGL